MEMKSVGLPETLHPEQRLKLPQVLILTGKGKTKLYADIKAGVFPEPEREGTRCSRWRAGTVIAHMNRASGVAA